MYPGNILDGIFLYFFLFYCTSFANSAVFMRSDNAALNICCPEGSQTAES